MRHEATHSTHASANLKIWTTEMNFNFRNLIIIQMSLIHLTYQWKELLLLNVEALNFSKSTIVKLNKEHFLDNNSLWLLERLTAAGERCSVRGGFCCSDTFKSDCLSMNSNAVGCSWKNHCAGNVVQFHNFQFAEIKCFTIQTQKFLQLVFEVN